MWFLGQGVSVVQQSLINNGMLSHMSPNLSKKVPAPVIWVLHKAKLI